MQSAWVSVEQEKQLRGSLKREGQERGLSLKTLMRQVSAYQKGAAAIVTRLHNEAGSLSLNTWPTRRLHGSLS